ncbi:MAG: HlyD family type I secretion periplasmic adaptor subunit [Desulfovibrio aminophilus]|uniref:HlyD family type I secretion periplasmic adaptor subunit n=1 Tax=Desulfovibrio aminophilus TaxID=81425 RepID=UPI0039E9E807
MVLRLEVTVRFLQRPFVRAIRDACCNLRQRKTIVRVVERCCSVWFTLREKTERFFDKTEPRNNDFAPALLRIHESSPSPIGRLVLRVLAGLLGVLFLWSVLGKLDIVSVAEGKLVPHTFLKIVQPAESGIVREILVKEGQTVAAGQVLMRMDTAISEADIRSLEADYERKMLTLRRIDAELAAAPAFKAESGDPPTLFTEIEAQFVANRAALEAALAEETSRLEKAKNDLLATKEVRAKLADVLPYYQSQEAAFNKLAGEGYAGTLQASDKRRERVEKEQELRTQEHLIESAQAGVTESEKKVAQIVSDYRRRLHTERNEVQGQLEKLEQDIAKQEHRRDLLELKAPGDGIVKDLATHTVGTVTQPGTVLLTLVPLDEVLDAEVWIPNQDRGFVAPEQSVKLKFAAFPFQKYGMIEGVVERISADAADSSGTTPQTNSVDRNARNTPLSYKAIVSLKKMSIAVDDHDQPLSAGMQVSAEILIGRRTVLEYLLSPVQKAVHESARER